MACITTAWSSHELSLNRKLKFALMRSAFCRGVKVASVHQFKPMKMGGNLVVNCEWIYLTIIPRAPVGYEMIDSQRGA